MESLSRVKKPVGKGEIKEIIYNKERWDLLKSLRLKALNIVEALVANGFNPIVYGSIARGDVNKKSDTDITILEVVPSYKVEVALENSGFKIVDRVIVQASPRHTVKAHIYLDELTTVTFPLVKMTKIEREFYKFGGELNFEELKKNIRVVGVDKRLMLIEPTNQGHIESSILGREIEVASKLKVSVSIVNERIRVLMRRNSIGRTGVYLKYRLKEDEVFEEVLKRIASEDPALRRMLIQRNFL